METNPPLRAPSYRRTRQFVRVYPTYPDISTSRPGGGSGSQSSSDLSHLPYLSFLLASLPCISSLFLSSTLPSFFSPFIILLFFLAFSFRIFFHISHFTFSLLPFFLFILFYTLLRILSLQSLFLSFLSSKFDPVSRITLFTGKIIKLTSGIHHGIYNTKH